MVSPLLNVADMSRNLYSGSRGPFSKNPVKTQKFRSFEAFWNMWKPETLSVLLRVENWTAIPIQILVLGFL